jgi:hypothetical protein
MKGINEFTAKELKDWLNGHDTEISGKWTPVRPIGMGGFIRRIKMAWKVFTGHADIVTWYKQ